MKPFKMIWISDSDGYVTKGNVYKVIAKELGIQTPHRRAYAYVFIDDTGTENKGMSFQFVSQKKEVRI